MSRTMQDVWTEVDLILWEHNKNASGKIDPQELREKLRELGATTLGALKQVSWEQLETCGLPNLLAKAVAASIRQSDTSSEKRPRTLLWARNADISDLIRHYDPTNPLSAVGESLKRRIKGAFLVFKDDNSVDVETSLMLANSLMMNEPERARINVKGKTRRIYSVGNGPNNFRLLHPITKEALLSDGTSLSDNLNWGEVSREARILLMLAVDSGEVKAKGMTPMELGQIYTMAMQGTAAIGSIAPRAMERFEELQAVQGLPPDRCIYDPSKRNPVHESDPTTAFVRRG